MAYTPHDWQTGEVITEEKLDHMEQGIEEASGGIRRIPILYAGTSYIMQETFRTIKELVDNGVFVYFTTEVDRSVGSRLNCGYIVDILIPNDEGTNCTISIVTDDGNPSATAPARITYTASTMDDRPSYYED